jgi:hypothetical protein
MTRGAASRIRRPDLALVPALLVCVSAPVIGTAGQTSGTGVIAGQVIDATTKRPLGGAVVSLGALEPASVAPGPAAVAPQPAQPALTRRAVALASAEGQFVFRDVPSGTYGLTSELDGYAGGATGRRRPGGPRSTLTLEAGGRVVGAVLTMWRLATISGVVRDDRGDPAIGVYVTAMRLTSANGRLELTLAGGSGESTDDRGHYRITGLMPGAYVVGARSSTQSAATSSVDAYQAAVTSGTSAAIPREWAQSGALRMPKSGLVVDGWQVTTSIGMPQPLPGPEGALLIHPNVFYPASRSPSDATVLMLAPGDERLGVDLTLPLVAGMRVSGVLNGPEGPAANHGVRLVPISATDPAFDVPVAYATTDAAGRFAFLGVPAGAYLVRAYRVQPVGAFRFVPPAAGALPGTGERVTPATDPPMPALFGELPVTVGSEPVDGLSLSLQPGARLAGRVVFEGASQPAAAQIQRIAMSIRPLAGTVPGAADARVDASRAFQTNGFPPGRYHIHVTPPGPEWTLASVRIAGADAAGQAFALGTRDVDEIVVTFTDKPITLTGTVRAADSGGSPDGTVVLFPADLDSWVATGLSSRRVASAPTSASGTYQIRVPLPGEYVAVAVPPDVAPEVDPDFVKRFASLGVRVTLLAGESKSQALTVVRVK